MINAFFFDDHFINSYNLVSSQYTDIVRKKLTLVNIGT